MAGVPHQAADGYIARLIGKGYRVAVCEQVGDPALSRGLVEREVVRVVTPGTVVDPAMLAAKRNNYLAAAVLGRDAVGIAYADITTGEFATTQFAAADPEAALLRELARVGPAEVLVEGGTGGHREERRRGRTRNEDTEDTEGRDRDLTAEGAENAEGRQSGGPHPPILPVNGSSLDEEEEDGLAARLRAVDAGLATAVTPYGARAFREEVARTALLDHFGVASLEGFGCEYLPLAVRAAGAVLAYLRETQRGVLPQLTALETYSTAGFMVLDAHTRRNLELFESGRGGGFKGSLLWVLDKTRSPMGGRLLRRWLGEPLLDLGVLGRRQAAVAVLYGDVALRARLAPTLGRVGDLERLTNRVLQRIATPRDLAALASGLRAVEELGRYGDLTAENAEDADRARSGDLTTESTEGTEGREGENGERLRRAGWLAGRAPSPVATGEGKRAGGGIAALPFLSGGRFGGVGMVAGLIEAAIVESPPLASTEGGIIRAGYSEELDHITTAARDARRWVADLERSERARTGIGNLRVGYNKVFGYYLEVTNSQLSRVPAEYIRKQTLTTGERYITPDLKEYEALILNAQERSARLEQELFARLRAEIAERYAEGILRAARALAELDVVLSLAEVAARLGYCRPELEESDAIHIVAGRHPVVELAQTDVPFVPNDVELSVGEQQILLLTGPNMAGKSTYLRQVALITLLAQIGSFVPAERARIGLVDRIFTRIGAQDDLATGQSTFMVEMVETANILHHATPRSLVVLDEIGRGTSTYDGLAIARAIVEYLHNNRRCGARTLFATHYHELVELARTLPRVRAYNVAVAEEAGEVVFLRKIVPGGADKSYGIHVARLAGIPRQVVRRAEEVLEGLERTGESRTRRRAMRDIPVPAAVQLTLFAAEPDPVVEELKALAVDELTPLEALTRLYELQRKARERA